MIGTEFALGTTQIESSQSMTNPASARYSDGISGG